MNKIYKLVWSKVRNTWVVASEIAKGHGKSSLSEGHGKLLKSLVLTALLGSLITRARRATMLLQSAGGQKQIRQVPWQSVTEPR